jgi:hypothetical protein
MMKRPEDTARPAAAITQWSIVTVDGADHLIGVLLGGHERLPAGHWVISSRIVAIDAANGIAVTASTGRVYVLGARLVGPLPAEARDLVAHATRIWRAKARLKAARTRHAANRGADHTAAGGDADPAGPTERGTAPRRDTVS